MQIVCKFKNANHETPTSIELSWFRAPALQAGGHWFESSIAHQKMKAQHNVLGFFCGIERSWINSTN